MSPIENEVIRELVAEVREYRQQVDGYHMDVATYIAQQDERCGRCREDLEGVTAELYGKQPRDELALGIKDRVCGVEVLTKSLLETRARWRRVFWWLAGTAGTGFATLSGKQLWNWIRGGS